MRSAGSSKEHCKHLQLLLQLERSICVTIISKFYSVSTYKVPEYLQSIIRTLTQKNTDTIHVYTMYVLQLHVYIHVVTYRGRQLQKELQQKSCYAFFILSKTRLDRSTVSFYGHVTAHGVGESGT